MAERENPLRGVITRDVLDFLDPEVLEDEGGGVPAAFDNGRGFQEPEEPAVLGAGDR